MSIEEDKEKLELHHRVLFGDEVTGEIGIYEMNKKMYSLMTSASNVGGFFSKIGNFFGWALLIGAGLLAFKHWGHSLLEFLAQK